jgi:FKBP-type peptidyl-prolyl cis-trans isomerase SlyD
VTITQNKIVAMRYTLRDEAGNVLDTSGDEALEYLQGHQNIIPGLERELTGLQPGERKQVTVAPEEGYGTYNPDLKFALDKEHFSGMTPEHGQMVELSTPNGESVLARIVDVTPEGIVLDANHPLAGQKLFFDVEITNIRDASGEELAHGHPHGPHGHHH